MKSLLGVPYEIYVAAGPGGAEASGLTTVTVLYLHGGIFVEFSRNLALLAEELAQKLGRTVRVLAPSLHAFFFTKKIGPSILNKCRNYVRTKSQWLLVEYSPLAIGLYSFFKKLLTLAPHIVSTLIK